MSELRWIIGVGAGIAVFGYAIRKGMESVRYKTIAAPSNASFERMSIELPESTGPWFPDRLPKPDNGLREAGRRYMARVTCHAASGPDGDAIVEGYWKGNESTNKIAGVLRVNRVISASGLRPALPFDLLVPPSKSSLDNDYLETVRWQSLHATGVSESPRYGKKPKVGTTVRYAMKERNSLGNAVVVLIGKVLNEASAYWPKDEGTPDDERVLVGVDDIVRSVRGGGEIALPSAFVIPVENLIEESPIA